MFTLSYEDVIDYSDCGPRCNICGDDSEREIGICEACIRDKFIEKFRELFKKYYGYDYLVIPIIEEDEVGNTYVLFKEKRNSLRLYGMEITPNRANLIDQFYKLDD